MDLNSLGFNGTYSDEHGEGCVERLCCESSCCDADETVYDATIECCVPKNDPNKAYLNLFQKTVPGYEIVEGGARGLLEYNLAGMEFVYDFYGERLEPGIEYMLLYFPDPWPGWGVICLDSGTIDANGEIRLKGSANTGNLPASFDRNSGAKIWLAISEEAKCDVPTRMVGFRRQPEYLFEETLIVFNDTDFDENDRLLPPRQPCTSNEQCQTGYCYESRSGTMTCAECSPETALGCTGNQFCTEDNGFPMCDWPDIASCEQDCPSGYCDWDLPEDRNYIVCASCNPSTGVGCNENLAIYG